MLPLEVHCDVAVARLRRAQGLGQQTRDRREVHVVDRGRDVPIAREGHTAHGRRARDLRRAERALRGQRDSARELARRTRACLETQRAARATHARIDVLEAPGDVAARVEIEHAAFAHEHVHVRRHVEANVRGAPGRRRRPLHPISAVGRPHERELGALEREPVDADVALRGEQRDQPERTHADARGTRRHERLAAARGRDAHAAERELRSEPAPTRVHLREIERKAELAVHPSLQVVAIARDLRE